MLVEDVMSTEVVTIEEDAPLGEAVEVMLKHQIGCIVATTGSPPRKTGILTKSDVIHTVSRAEASSSPVGRVGAIIKALLGRQSDGPLSSSSVRDSMRLPLVTVSPDMTLSDAVARMREEGVRQLVITEKMDLAGIVTLADIGHEHDGIVREVRQINAHRPNWNERHN